MSHIVVQCPGCLSKLRIRGSTSKTQIACPRCDEQISLLELISISPDADQSAPVTKTKSGSATPHSQRRPKAQAASPVDDDHELVDDFIDEEEQRARKETYIFLGLMGIMLVFAVVAFPKGIQYLLNSENDEAAEVVIHSPSQPDAPVTASVKDSREPSENVNAERTEPTATDSADSPSATFSSATKTDAADDEGPALALPEPKVVPPGDSAAPAAVAKIPSSPVPENDPAPRSDDIRLKVEGPQLRYGWAAGQEHIYQLKIVADANGTKHTINGSCTYKVQSEARQPEGQAEGAGTGFVVTSNGIVATCAHVVDRARKIEVTLAGNTYPAKVLVSERSVDLALLQIEADGLPVAALTDSDRVQLAEPVRAFGFPLSTVLGTGIKVATGAVAGIVMHPLHGKQFQTDAPINPGNSGGPIVNDFGQVIGIASSKLASSAASSVGFAVPVNELIELMREQGLTPVRSDSDEKLDGPELARRLTPAVAFIKVSGLSSGDVYDLSFSASFTQTQSFNPGRLRLGGMPLLPSTSHDRGTLKVSDAGDVVEFGGQESLPFVLGPIGQFFIEPLDPYGDAIWTNESITSLRVVKRQANDPISRMRSRMPMIPRGGFNPFRNEPEEETIKVVPAMELTTYRLGPELNNRISIRKEYSFRTTDSAERPFLSVSGNGEIVFDKAKGMPVSLEYDARLTQTDEDGTVDHLPITVTYTLRDPEEVKREREAAVKKAEEERLRREVERNTPNPELVAELLANIRRAEGGLGALSHFQHLARVAIVPETRDEVLKVSANHMKNSNEFVQAAAAEIYCRWVDDESAADQLWKVVRDPSHLLNNARKVAIDRLIEFDQPDVYRELIGLMSNISMRFDVKKRLIDSGNVVEGSVLEAWPAVSDTSVRRDLLEVLQKVGSKSSVPLLERLVQETDVLMKHSAQRALDAIRARF